MATTDQPVSQAVDDIVVGSGPGGASVARALARAGRRVVILERGRDYRGSAVYGTYLGALLYADRRALLFTHEGLNIIRPLMAGGATSMYCGCAAEPPEWLAARYGLDLHSYTRAITAELGLAPLPAPLRGPASTRLAEAAGDLGYDWQPLPKFMQPGRAPGGFDCGAKCMLGCRCGAKWSAAEWVDQAVAAGAEFRTQARVDDLLVAGRHVEGVRGRWRGRPFELRAGRVILAAGGIGSPLLLRRAGLAGAGEGLSMDTTVIVYGVTAEPGNGTEPPMTYAWESPDPDCRFMLSSLVDPWLMYPLMTGLLGPRYALTWPRWGRSLGVMIKLKDDLAGYVRGERDISKPFTSGDQARLDQAVRIARQILQRAGAGPETIFVSPKRGTHPCATVRVGDGLDGDLQTDIHGLYVCDASAFPEALARPTVLTILALGQRLADHLLARPPAAASV
jgi:choline dehydrogenase-like flavoprotein